MFGAGVVKICRGQAHSLTNSERVACSRLQKTNIEINNTEEEKSELTTDGEIIARKRRSRECQDGTHVNCGFILGSTAEIERLWSIAKCILTNNQSKMTPVLLKELVFLKTNRKHLD